MQNKPLNILSISCCYNGLDILPYILEYNRKEGIDSFVLDNYSTDGSWEYLQDNKIPSKRMDTDGAFHVTKIQDAKKEIIHGLKPDWVLRGSSDHFILTPNSLRETIETVDNDGYNAISMPFYRIKNTGEERLENGDPRKIYFYYSPHFAQENFGCAIHKVNGFNGYSADDIDMTNIKTYIINGACLLDYGDTRSAEKRDKEYQRRQLAWGRGEPWLYGRHYVSGSERNWEWEKDTLLDIRESEYWSMLCDRFGDV